MLSDSETFGLPKYMEARVSSRGWTTYRVLLPTGKRVNLGKDLPEALEKYDRLMPPDQSDFAQCAADLWLRARNRAATAGYQFSLEPHDIKAMLEAQGGRCAITGRRFKNTVPDGQRIRTYGASLDRIDCNKGYTIENCRIVCAYVNIALNRFGEELILELAKALVKADKARARAEKARAAADAVPG